MMERAACAVVGRRRSCEVSGVQQADEAWRLAFVSVMILLLRSAPREPGGQTIDRRRMTGQKADLAQI